MKTAEEKAKEVCRKANLPESGVVYSLVYSALKEQDRDTRHACAEAVVTLPTCRGAYGYHIFDTEGQLCDAIDKNAAHAACMNVKAV